MGQFIAMVPDVEVSGAGIRSIMHAMGPFQKVGADILSSHHITQVNPNKWYALQDFLDTLKDIYNRLGTAVLFEIGKQIPQDAVFPPDIRTFEDAIASIDVAYHMNHRRGGKVMFDPIHRTMLEGIGHDRYIPSSDPSRNPPQVICDNPHPCDFDRGIITTMARRFKPAGALLMQVVHAPSPPCRNSGDHLCTYEINW